MEIHNFILGSSINISGEQIHLKYQNLQKMRKKAGENKEMWKRLIVLGRVMTVGRTEEN